MKRFAALFVLTALGSLSAAIIDTIKSMPDNTWLRLPVNGPSPITRSSSNVMHYDGDSIGYLWGTCHAHHHNDLWAFNVAANRWREVQPTEPSAQTDPLVLQNKDSIVMTRLERPLSAHQWSNMDFDVDRKKLLLFSYGWWQGIYSGHDSVICQYRPGPTCNKHTNRKVMGQYDPATNVWAPVKFNISWPLTCSTCGSAVLRYVPYLKKFVAFIFGVYTDRFVLVDPANATMQTVTATLEPIAGDNATSGSGMLGGAVWDSFREVLIFAGRGNTGTWSLNPKTMTFKQIVTKAGSPTVWTDCATSHMVYDSGNKATLVYTTPGLQQCYGGGNWPSRSAVYVLDYEGGKWDLLPAPPSGQSPTSTSASNVHSYFDQNMGVIFHYEGGYCAANGVKWIYKYKAVPGIPRTVSAEKFSGKAFDGKGQITFSANPARGPVLIRTAAGKAEISIRDIRGRRIGRISGNPALWNPLRHPNGIYLVSAPGERAAKLILDQ